MEARAQVLWAGGFVQAVHGPVQIPSPSSCQAVGMSERFLSLSRALSHYDECFSCLLKMML